MLSLLEADVNVPPKSLVPFVFFEKEMICLPLSLHPWYFALLLSRFLRGLFTFTYLLIYVSMAVQHSLTQG